MAGNLPNKPRFIVIHFSQSTDRGGYSAELIDKDHKRFGFYPCILPSRKRFHIGYHYYINRKGWVTSLRPENVIGQHCEGYNQRSIGVCIEGKKEVLTKDNLDNIVSLVITLMGKYNISVDNVKGHNELQPLKTRKDGSTYPNPCPNFIMDHLRDLISKLTKGEVEK